LDTDALYPRCRAAGYYDKIKHEDLLTLGQGVQHKDSLFKKMDVIKASPEGLKASRSFSQNILNPAK
jgi:hypothetical protein